MKAIDFNDADIERFYGVLKNMEFYTDSVILQIKTKLEKMYKTKFGPNTVKGFKKSLLGLINILESKRSAVTKTEYKTEPNGQLLLF